MVMRTSRQRAATPEARTEDLTVAQIGDDVEELDREPPADRAKADGGNADRDELADEQADRAIERALAISGVDWYDAPERHPPR